MKSSRWLILFSLTLLSAAALCTGPGAAASPPQQQPQQPAETPGTIRVRVTLIPVDAIVTDKNLKPVLDLQQGDFTILENGQPQDIQHFSVQELKAEVPAPEEKPLLRKVPALELTPQNSRTFLILLGRGRHQAAFKAVDSMIRFVQEELLPQDRVAVFAYNRATDFTTDHGKIVQVLEQYKKVHEKIEAKLESRFRGLAGVYGSKEMPKTLQPDIDSIFSAAGGPGSRQIPPGRVADAASMTETTQAVSETNQRVETEAIRAEMSGAGEDATSTTLFDRMEMESVTDLPFEDYVSTNAMTHQDMQNIFTAIEYLRFMEGEKHLLFFTSDGLFLPGDEYDMSLASMANDARVAIHTFQTGGLYSQGAGFSGYSAIDSRKINLNNRRLEPAPVVRSSASATWALSSLRNVSDLTGGRSAVGEDLNKALTNVSEITQVKYLLGYYPKNTEWDGKYRRIQVKVNKPGLNVLYRHGYYAHDTVQPYDRETFLTYSRISAAAEYQEDIKDLLFRAAAIKMADASGNPMAQVNILIDPTKVHFESAAGLHATKLHLAVFYSDSRGNPLGDAWKTLDLNLKEETYQRVLKLGIPYLIQVPMYDVRQMFKVVVYDYTLDKVGSLVTKIR